MGSGLRYCRYWDIISGLCPGFDIRVNSTAHLAELSGQRAPDQVMITVHPQRWQDWHLPWVKELVWQNVKNVMKWGIMKLKS